MVVLGIVLGSGGSSIPPVGLALGEELGEAVLAHLDDLDVFEARGGLVALESFLADLSDLASWAKIE